MSISCRVVGSNGGRLVTVSSEDGSEISPSLLCSEKLAEEFHGDWAPLMPASRLPMRKSSPLLFDEQPDSSVFDEPIANIYV